MYLLKRTAPTGAVKYVCKRAGHSYKGYYSTCNAVEFPDEVSAMIFLQNHKDFMNGGYVPVEIDNVITAVDGQKLFIEKTSTEDNCQTKESACEGASVSSTHFMVNNIKSSIPKTIHVNTVQVAKHDSENKKMTDEHITELIEQLRDGVDKITNVYSELNNAYEYCNKSLDNVNWEIIDIEHAVELYDMNAYDSFKMASKLKEKRKIRRIYKDFFEVIERLEKDNNLFGFQNGSTANSLHALDRRTYTPRKMEDLFEDLDKKYKHNI